MQRSVTTILAIAAAGALTIAIGLLMPAWMTDGSENMPSQAQPLARDALLRARIGCLDHPFSSGPVLRLRVESTEVREGCRSRVFPEFSGYLVRVSGRTIFWAAPREHHDLRRRNVVPWSVGWPTQRPARRLSGLLIVRGAE
jgi:hypothetical protein